MAAIPTPKKFALFTFFLLTTLVSSFTFAMSSSLVKLGAAADCVNNGGGGDVDYSCVYTVFVRTGSLPKSGTDSAISVEFAGEDGGGVRIADLERWGGLMGPRHDYYERGSLDLFSGRGPCLAAPPCWMNLTSDGSGARHGWYCSDVEVTVTGPRRGCAQRRFEVGQWLATDHSPYRLAAVRDQCRAARRGSAAA